MRVKVAIAFLALIVLEGVECQRESKRNRDNVKYVRGERINDTGKAGIFPIRKSEGTHQGKSLSRSNEDALKASIKRSGNTRSFSSNPYLCDHVNRTQPYTLCGYPMVYRKQDCAAIYCDKLPLKYCENEEGMITFGMLTFLIGFVIVISNLLLPYALIRKREMRTNPNYIKVSLSFADILCGIVLMISIIPNIITMRNSTEMEIVESSDDESLFSTISGALLALSLEASLLHLVLLSVERYLALRWALQQRGLDRRKILMLITIVWCISAFVALTGVIFPRVFSYKMLPVLLVSIPTALQNDGETVSDGLLIYAVTTVLLPYLLMVTVCALTWFAVRSRRMKSSKLRGDMWVNRDQPKGILAKVCWLMKRTEQSPEVIVFKSLLIMIAAFSITILPLVVVVVQYYIGYYNCESYAVPYTLSFYAGVSNSFVNVLIYTFRDRHFRAAITSSCCCGLESGRNLPTSRDVLQTMSDL